MRQFLNRCIVLFTALGLVAQASVAQIYYPQVYGHGTAARAIRVELPTDGTGIVGLASGSNTIGSIANISGTISLPTGAATLAEQQTQTTHLGTLAGGVSSSKFQANLAQVAGASTATGHGTASGALRVELPTDGTGLVSAAQSGTWNINNVSGTISLPTGASTEATLSTLNGKVTQGHGTAAAAIRVELPTDGTGLVSAAQSGTWTVRGPETSGTPLAGAPIAVAGHDGTNVRLIKTDVSGEVIVVGQAASGATTTANPLQVAGSDGTNVRTLKTATDGTVIVGDGSGSLNVIVDSGTTAVTQATASNLNAQVVGAAANNGSVTSVNPLGAGGLGKSSFPTAVTTGNLVWTLHDLIGRLAVAPYGIPEASVDGTATNTDGAAFAVIASQGGTNRTIITNWTVSNAHASTDCNVVLVDGASNRYQVQVPHNSAVTMTFPMGLRGSQATAWNCDASAAVTTIICSLSGYVVPY